MYFCGFVYRCVWLSPASYMRPRSAGHASGPSAWPRPPLDLLYCPCASYTGTQGLKRVDALFGGDLCAPIHALLYATSAALAWKGYPLCAAVCLVIDVLVGIVASRVYKGFTVRPKYRRLDERASMLQ
mgnify:CR=1 FL=1